MIVNPVYELVQKLTAKFSAGGYLPSNDFEKFSDLAQNQKLEFELSKKPGSTFNAESLSGFKVDGWVNVISGVVVNPADFRYFDSAYNVASGSGSMVPSAFEELTSDEWKWRLGSELDRPTEAYPALIQQDGVIKVAPSTIKSVNLTYVKNPPPVVWGYTIVNNRKVYNESSSVDFLFGEADIPDLVYRILVMSGVQIRDVELVQSAMNERQKTEQ